MRYRKIFPERKKKKEVSPLLEEDSQKLDEQLLGWALLKRHNGLSSYTSVDTGPEITSDYPPDSKDQ